MKAACAYLAVAISLLAWLLVGVNLHDSNRVDNGDGYSRGYRAAVDSIGSANNGSLRNAEDFMLRFGAVNCLRSADGDTVYVVVMP